MPGVPVFLHHPSSLAHDTGPHPERAARIVAIERELDRREWLGWERRSSPAIARELLLAVHDERHVSTVERLSGAGGGQLDLDTVMSAGSLEAALHAAGGAVELVRLLIAGEAPCGFSAHRPPGHHATAGQSMGFCVFNNIAIAAQYALDAHGLERVLVLDWDVHHGNGTNDIFHDSARVLFASIHESPLYPGTGPARDVGTGAGIGYTVNLPVGPGSGDEVFAGLLAGVVAALARSYRPQLVLISAGYDAHRDDPLADCTVTDSGYAEMARCVRGVADELGVPVGIVLEGGYALEPLARSVAATMAAIAEPGSGSPRPEGGELHPLAREARARLARWWPELG